MSRREPEVPNSTARRELEAVDAALRGAALSPELRELEALVRDVRSERPVPRKEFAAQLDRRVADGFAAIPAPGSSAGGGAGRRWREGRPPPRLRGVRRGWTPALAAAACVLLALVVAVSALRSGQVVDGGGTETTELDARQAPSRAGEPEPGSMVAAPDDTARRSPGGELPGRRDRRVERQASLTLAAPAERIDEAADGVIRVVDRHGGIVVSSTVQSGDDRSGGANFDLRVPVDRLRVTLSDLSEIAHVRSRTQSSQDVTGAHVSTGERLREALAERSSLLRQLARAETATEAESLRAQLRLVNARIAGARGERRRLNERASFASVTVSIQPESASGIGHDRLWTPREALRDALRILEMMASVLVVAFAVLLPLALGGLAVAYAARRWRRRQREQALDAG